MTKYSELQQELLLMWSSRKKDITGLTETGRSFPLVKPMFSVLSYKTYKGMLQDMRRRMQSMRKQMQDLQKEMNQVLKIIEGSSPQVAPKR
jgi:hypothetical protein